MEPSKLTTSPFASHISRLSAFCVDLGLLALAQGGGSLFGSWLITQMAEPNPTTRALEKAQTQGGFLGWLVAGIAVWGLNYGILQGLTGASVGKNFFGLRITLENGAPVGVFRSLFRSLCYILSLAPFGVGFVSLLWSEGHQAWHDLLAGTLVLKRGARVPYAGPERRRVPREEAKAPEITDERRAA